jgi:hypothetical protein
VRRAERRIERRQQKHQAAAANAANGAGSSNSTTTASGAADFARTAGASGVPYQYNRFFVNEQFDFVPTEVVAEDPAIIEQRRTLLPEPTKEDTWRTPQKPMFEPLVPFLRIADYSKDPDVKLLKPINVPRWKDFMHRSKPVVPRTWY